MTYTNIIIQCIAAIQAAYTGNKEIETLLSIIDGAVRELQAVLVRQK